MRTSFGQLVRAPILPTFVFFVGLTWLSGIAITDSIGIGVALMVQALIGLRLLPSHLRTSDRPVIRQLGLGLALGSALVAIAFQVFNVLLPGVNAIVWMAVLLVVTTLIGPRQPWFSVQNGQEDWLEGVLAVSIGATLALGLTTGWHLVHLLALMTSWIVFTWIKRREQSPSFLGRLVVLLPILVVGGMFRLSTDFTLVREVIWDGDNSIFQTLINTFEQWGLLENAGSVGEAPFIGYHWATFSWVASLESVLGTGPWVTMQLAVPTIVSVVFAAVVWDFLRSRMSSMISLGWGLVALAIVIAVSFRPDGSVSLFITDMWVAAYIVLLALATSHRSMARYVPALSVLFAAIWVGKRSTGVVLLAALLLLVIVSIVWVREHRRSAIALAAIGVGVLVIDQLALQAVQSLAGLTFSDLSSGDGRVGFEFISESAFGYPGTLNGISAVVAAIVVTVSIFAIAFLSIGFAPLTHRHLWFLFAACAVVVSAVVPFVLDGEVLAVYYYSRHPGLLLSVFVLGALLVSDQAVALVKSAFSRDAVLRTVLAWALFIGLWVTWLQVIDVGEARSGRSLGIMRDAVWLFVLVVTPVVYIVLRKRGRELGAFALVGLLVASALAVLPKYVDELTNERIRPLVEAAPPRESLDIPSEEVEAVGSWLRANTEEAAVIGSNLFCESHQKALYFCTSENWWSEWIERAHVEGLFAGDCRVETVERIGRVQNYVLPSVADRRFYIQGPGLSNGCQDDVEWVSQRIHTSERFARNADLDACSELANAGVQYFVVDRRSTSRTQWSPAASIELQNDAFVVLKLDRGLCTN